MAEYSYATERKIRVIRENHGDNWREKFPGRSIDSIYVELTGDDRKNLFCKVSPDTKEMLDEMLKAYGARMSLFVESLITTEYDRHKRREQEKHEQIRKSFTR